MGNTEATEAASAPSADEAGDAAAEAAAPHASAAAASGCAGGASAAVAVGLPRLLEVHQDGTKAPAVETTKELWAQLDTNRDGVVTKEEFEAAISTAAAAAQTQAALGESCSAAGAVSPRQAALPAALLATAAEMIPRETAMTKAQVVGRPVKMDSLDAYGFVGGEESEEAPRVTRQFTDAEAAILRCAKRHWTMRQEENDRARRASELQELLAQTREQLLVEPTTNWMPANRYGNAALLPAFEPGKHVPVLALINPYSGAMAGTDILSIARKSPYYQQRFFNIIDVVKDQRRGGLLDLFRIELNAAKDEAKAMGTRPRIISGGGDGTASFSLFMVFAALRADDSRGDDIVEDSGNGFIWTDEEMRDSFPALAQMPLGSANDFGHTLGWGHKYPGDFECTGCVGSRHKALNALQVWIEAVINPSTRLANFDLFGFCPAEGQDSYNFRLAELTGRRGMNPKVLADGKQHLLMKEAGTPVPLFCCLYFSAGFAAYMTARFQINRRSKPLHNKLEYARQAIGIVSEQVPPQLQNGLEGIEINCGGSRYFPPREDDDEHAGSRYREVGFLNINWQAGMAHGADRAPACTRLCAIREPAKFNDGMVDMYRLKFSSAFKNPGLHIQTDKKEHGMTLSFKGGLGKGVFFQWDGEARFAFSPTGEPFDINVRKILNVPVVLGPEYNAKVTGDPDNGHAVHFAFVAKTLEQQQAVRERILRGVRNELNRELNATREEMLKVGLQCEELPRAHQHHPSQ